MLRALNALHTAGLTDDELCEMGLKLGADVPFCLRGGTMLAQGIGEELSLLPDMPHCWVVLCKPPFAVPTKEVYQEIDSVDDPRASGQQGHDGRAQSGMIYEGVCAYLSNFYSVFRYLDKDKVSCLLDVSSGEIFMLAYICLSIVCSASLFIAFGTVVPSQWQRCAIRVAGPCHRSGTVLPL